MANGEWPSRGRFLPAASRSAGALRTFLRRALELGVGDDRLSRIRGISIASEAKFVHVGGGQPPPVVKKLFRVVLPCVAYAALVSHDVPGQIKSEVIRLLVVAPSGEFSLGPVHHDAAIERCEFRNLLGRNVKSDHGFHRIVMGRGELVLRKFCRRSEERRVGKESRAEWVV